MDSLEKELRAATAEKKIPAVLLAASNASGSFNYFKAFGNTSLQDGAPPASAATTMVLASATKLTTCVAAIQIVSRGLIGLDDDVTSILTERKDAVILTGFEEESNKPIFVKAKNVITLRRLLSHTSGIMSLESEDLGRYYRSLEDSRGTLMERYFMTDDPVVKAKALEEVRVVMQTLTVDPLAFEPGTSFTYGQGIDWAGQLIERLTKMSLEEYCQANIFTPLSMKSTTFHPLSHPHVLSNLLPMSGRGKDGSISTIPSIYPLSSPIDMGGGNLFSSAPDYLALLTSLLKNDEKVLNKAAAEMMFGARLGEGEGFTEFKRGDGEDFVEEGGEEGVVDQCLAGLVVMRDIAGRRRDGSVTWGGATRCYWWIDWKAGICGFYGTSIMGMGDQGISAAMFRKFEEAVYADCGTV